MFKRLRSVFAIAASFFAGIFVTIAGLVIAQSQAGDCSTGSQSEQVQEGDPVPSFEVDLLDREGSLTDEQLAGQPYLLHIWATSCGICRNEMAYLQEAHDTFDENGIEIISIAWDEDIDAVRTYREEEYSMPWKHSVRAENPEQVQALAKNLGASGFPTKVLVSEEGEVLEYMDGATGDVFAEQVVSHFGAH